MTINSALRIAQPAAPRTDYAIKQQISRHGIGTSLDQARFDAYCFSDNLASKHNICGVYSTTHGYATDLYVSLQA
ncbi:MAG: hypothetical protein H0T62_08485 [Parachlamydiaceae bacterium]|nr:hypothetical protein [Parachlamydiaceae bacterium]